MRSNQPPFCPKSAGVTLMELLMIAVIMGILAAVAIPGFRRTVEQGYRREAADILMTIYHGQRAYYFTKSPPNARTYYGPLSSSSTDQDWGQIFMDNPNLSSIPVEFSVPFFGGTGASAAFQATAARTADPCGAGVRRLFIDEQRQFTSSWPESGDCPAPVSSLGSGPRNRRPGT